MTIGETRDGGSPRNESSLPIRGEVVALEKGEPSLPAPDMGRVRMADHSAPARAGRMLDGGGGRFAGGWGQAGWAAHATWATRRRRARRG